MPLGDECVNSNGNGDYKTVGYFPFPFPPYDIQEEFMRRLYEAIENGKIGIFESPTGTGKSLSLICGSLTWLRDYEKAQQDDFNKMISENDDSRNDSKDNDKTNEQCQSCKEPSWVNEFEEKRAQKDLIEKINLKRSHMEKNKAKIDLLKKKRQYEIAARNKRKRESSSTPPAEVNADGLNGGKTDDAEDNEDDDLILEDYHSDIDEKHEAESSSGSEDEEEEQQHFTKIYYCSRTHSQLSQFVSEVRKSPFGQDIKVVTLGSRQNYCINPAVQQLRSINRINERCLELQRLKRDKKLPNKDKTKKRKVNGCGCPFYQTKKFKEFVDHVFVEVQDIEQLVGLGKDLETCPYYGSRFSVPQAQLVALPYNTLLHKPTREANKIKLQDSIVIIDEAHNLIDTINNVHSIEISGIHITTSRDQLQQYLNRYRSRLKAKNLLYINQLLSILDTFIQFLRGPNKKLKNTERQEGDRIETNLFTINDFVFSSRIDNLNLFKIRKYCEKSMITKKLNGFVDRYQQNLVSPHNGTNDEGPRTSQFFQIEAFLEALTNSNEDGRILVTKHVILAECSLKFLLLNPAVHFADITKEARAIVVAGGTMQPTSEFKDVLLHSAGVPAERIVEFSCGHVIPPENLIAIALCKGPSSVDLDFTFQNRENHQMIDELGRLIVNICTVVPGGVVCFFPSYEYEEKIHSKWSGNGILQRIEARKKVFREPRKSGNIDNILDSYSKCVMRCKSVKSSNEKSQQTGAVLFSVVGGKMSEGINFSDDLGRCILMVGLPYPNKHSAELKEKMNYLDKTVGPGSGQQHYENICMKAVNQSIGRAIRHRGDYACICLLDQRYTRNSVQSKLPSWIRSRLQMHSRFGPAFASLNKFFADKRTIH